MDEDHNRIGLGTDGVPVNADLPDQKLVCYANQGMQPGAPTKAEPFFARFYFYPFRFCIQPR